jgi:hypothetical protein
MEELGRRRPPGPSEREATDGDRLGWARRDWAADKPDEVIAVASRVTDSPAASPSQRAEALRLRAMAHARKQLYSAAAADAEHALVLEPDPTTIVSASDLRELVGYWKRLPDRTGPLLLS